MRELLVTITLLSAVSSEEFEPKKRLGIPPEEDPNFWPTRGRRSYWSSPSLIGNLVHQNLPKGPEIDYAGRESSWSSENGFLSAPEALGISDNWRSNTCSRRSPISLVLPLQEYQPEETEVFGCGGRCSGPIRERGRRGDATTRRQLPLFAEEPGWIAINYDTGVLQGSMVNEDPFILARGKKQRDEIFDPRQRRQLEDVLSSYDADPFFVARGKRNIDYGGDEFVKEIEAPNFEVNVIDKFDSIPRRRRSIEWEDKKASKSEESEVLKSKNFQDSKFFPADLQDGRIPKNEKNDKERFSTSQAVKKKKEYDNRHNRLQRSSSNADIFGNDENNKWIKSSEVPHVFHDISGVRPRYSRPRDKHSNLQSILDEPFFVSRGKKNRADDIGVEYSPYINNREGEGRIEGGKELPIEIRREFQVAPGIWKNFYADERALKISEDPEFFGKIFEDGFKRFETQSNKPPRSRRGMLDELLKGDDPFYVARGKRILYPFRAQPRTKYFDLTIDEGNVPPLINNGKYSIFAKSTRTKLLQKLPDLSKIIPKLYPYKVKDRHFWNLTSNAISNNN